MLYLLDICESYSIIFHVIVNKVCVISCRRLNGLCNSYSYIYSTCDPVVEN